MLRRWLVKHRALSPLGPAGLVLLAGAAAVVAYVATRSSQNEVKADTSEEESVDKPKIVPYLPSKVPVIGNMLQLATNAHRFHDWMAEQCIAHNGVFKLYLPGQSDMLVTAVPEHYEHVVKTQFDHFSKGHQQYDMFVDLMGHSVLIIEGERWKYHRRLLVRLFSARALREHMTPVIQRHTLLLQKVLLKAAIAKKPVDLYMLMHRFTFKAFAEMVFNNTLDSIDSEHEHPFEQAFDEAQSIVAGRLQQPVWFWKLKRWMNVGQERKLREDVELIDNFIMKIISTAIETRRQRQEDLKAGKPDGDMVSPTDVRNIAVAALGAGRDTSADAMTWLFHTLTQHPQVENKLRAEIFDKLPKIRTSSTYVPSMDEVQGLVYLEATIRELLRLQTPVPFTMRECIHDTVFSDGTFVPKGTNVGMCHFGAARSTEVWGPDAAEFKPERFIDPETGKLLRTPTAKCNAFSGGPRVCVGKALAMLEMKLVIATLVGRFHFTEVPGQNVHYAMGITIGMRSSLMMNVQPVTGGAPGAAA
ncbi:cytochrome P450, putative [Phytophthora infestans T30-4]|uniref:Cytochrome P450, putative n=1 Tax=Phytophthora infestans (strain T30-4) TaxID=403677 RepID=D0P487_PHYIT|nr:cytochrome P450, putative [Phytophthora infestans T30-4]EEY63452.1 cytochrome P450, putative [Phytophthora infestans T30-4]|eukprot:XP_002894891.1 cytochrome P450, putative [Phytophthora infestans T30-4]